MSNRAAKLSYRLNADQKAALRKHVIDLALYRNREPSPFNKGLAALQDQASRNVLLAVFAAALLLNVANGSYERVEICERDVAEADNTLDRIIGNLLHLATEMERGWTKFGAGDPGWGENVVACMVHAGVQVLSIRKIYAARTGQDMETVR